MAEIATEQLKPHNLQLQAGGLQKNVNTQAPGELNFTAI
jgi:hypothetical protein